MQAVLGTPKRKYRVESRSMMIPGLRAHTRGPRFQPKSAGLWRPVHQHLARSLSSTAGLIEVGGGYT